MRRDILIRGVPAEVDLWIGEECSRYRVSKREFVVSVLQKAYERKYEGQMTLFPTARTVVERAVPGTLPFRFIDLFSGIGGFRIALEKLGGSCAFSCEWDRYAQKTQKAWFNEEPAGDIRKIKPTDIPDHDILAAGFPCQPFSIAGVSKKNSLGRPHGFGCAQQGNLFFALATIIEAKRPPVAILENVKNLQSHDGGRTWQVIRETLRDLDYVVRPAVIDAAGWVPQHRERIFIVCFDRHIFGGDPDFAFPEPPAGPRPKLADILEATPPEKYTLSEHLWGYLQEYARRHQEKGNGFGFGLASPDGITRTLSARYYKDGSEILIPQGKGRPPRRLTPRECARLMGFPEDSAIVVSDTQAYRQFGNAVVPPVVEAVGREVLRTISGYLQQKGCLVKAPVVPYRSRKAS
jgi:DNA (cytosine-5)-methyltransferase 1